MVQLFTLVAFRRDQVRSVFYQNTSSVDTLAKWLKDCLENKHADVISIRRVQTEG